MENQEKNETTVLPENPEIMVKNPRIGKVRKLEEEVRRQNELHAGFRNRFSLWQNEYRG